LSTSSSDRFGQAKAAKGVAILVAKLCLFALPLVAIGLALEAGMRRHPDTNQRKRTAWEAAADSTRVLILGSSHAQFGLRPDVFAVPAFNLAGFSQTFRYDSALLARSIERMPRLRVVILTISYFSFQEELGSDVEPWRCWSYRDAWGIAVPSDLSFHDPARWSRVARLGNWRSAMQALKGFPPPPELVPIGPDGWGSASAPHPGRVQDASWARERIRAWHASMDSSRRLAQVRRLGHVLSMARAAGVKMILVAPPILEPLRRSGSPDIGLENRRFADSLARAHGAVVLDFEADPSFVATDFLDMDHLGPAAAARLSRLVWEKGGMDSVLP
jgi:hypothetical protein